MSKTTDKIQFARLIDEMMAALDGSTVTKMINDMATSMDLTSGEVNKLLDRAVADCDGAAGRLRAWTKSFPFFHAVEETDTWTVARTSI